jgi:hypothetical protein
MIKSRHLPFLSMVLAFLTLPVHSQEPPLAAHYIASESDKFTDGSTRPAESPKSLWEGVLPPLTSQTSLTYGICKTRCTGFIVITWQAASYQECCHGMLPRVTTP